MRRIADRRSLQPLLAGTAVPANSDYRPYVDQRAGRAQFLQTTATELLSLNEPLPVVAMLGSGVPAAAGTPRLSPLVQRTAPARTAFLFVEAVRTSPPGAVPAWLSWERPEIATALRGLLDACASPPPADRAAIPYRIATEVAPYLQPAEIQMPWNALERLAVRRLAPARRPRLVGAFCAVGRRDARGMAAIGRALLERGETPVERRPYLFRAALLGSAALGDTRGAGELWAAQRGRVFGSAPLPLDVRVVAAHAGLKPR